MQECLIGNQKTTKAVNLMKNKNAFKNNIWLIKKVWKHTPLYLISVIGYGLLRGIYTAVNVIYAKELLNMISAKAEFEVVITWIICYALFSILTNLFFNWYWHYCWAVNNEVVHQKIQIELFNHAVSLDLSKYDDPEFYNNYIWALDQSYAQVRNLMNYCADIIISIMSVVTLTGILLAIDVNITIFIFAFCLLRVFLTTAYNKLSVKYAEESNPLQRKDNYIRRVFILPEFAASIRTSRVFENLFESFSENCEKKDDLVDKYAFKKAVLSFLLGLFGFCADGLLLIYLAYNVMVTKSIDIGGLAVAVGGVWKFSFYLKNIIDKILKFQETALFSEKIINFTETNATIVSGNKKVNDFESLEIKNLAFQYSEDSSAVLKNISFKISKGEKIAIVGYNGAGKTTLTKLIMRLYDPSEGEILYNGTNIKEYELKGIREKFAAVFQDYQIFAASIKENVAGGETEEKDEKLIKEALQNSTFTDKLNALTNGLDTILTKEFDNSGTQLSGGERQKIAIARGFYKNSDLIILDEPSSALDPDAEYELNKAITEYAKEKTVIFISHRLSTTRNADKIYMFKDGEIIESGSHEELMSKNGQYAYMFNLQAEKYTKE